MKRFIQLIFVMVGIASISSQVFATEISNNELQQMLKNTNKKLEALQKKISNENSGEDSENWGDRITISGCLEAEAGYENLDVDDPAVEDANASDVALATVELGIEAEISSNITGNMVFLWEEGDSVALDVDQGFIAIEGNEKLPLYLNVGKMVLPFGNYESHLVSDPITLELGEINDTAIKFGFNIEMIDFSISLFNGHVNEIDSDDDHIADVVVNGQLCLPEGLIPNLELTAGLSFISNIANTGGAEGFAQDVAGDGSDLRIKDSVPGFNIFVSASLMDKLFFEAEYVGATDDFLPEDTGLNKKIKPAAWNIEGAIAPIDDLELAIRYEGSEDLANEHPESQFGCAASYSLSDAATASFELLFGKFENDNQRTLIKAKLGVEF